MPRRDGKKIHFTEHVDQPPMYDIASPPEESVESGKKPRVSSSPHTGNGHLFGNSISTVTG